MSGNWPLDIADKTYSAASFEGREYVQAYPELLSDWVANSQDRYTGYSDSTFQPSIGYTVLQASRFRRWTPGMRLYFSDATGQTGTKCMFHVMVYNQITGYLAGYIDATNMGRAPLRWAITARLLRVSHTAGFVDIADGGIGSYGVFGRRNAVNVSSPASMEIFEDFNRYSGASPINLTSAPFSVYKTGSTGNNGHYMNVAFPDTRNNTCGLLLTRTFSSGDKVGLYHNASASYLLNAANDAEWRSHIYIPTLSNATHRFTIRIGMAAVGSNWTTNIFSYGGFGFVYSDNVNSGNWQLVYGQSNTVSTINSSIAVATGWNALRMVYSGGTLTYYVNGVSAGSTSSGLPTSGSLNLCAPAQLTTRDAGSSTTRDWWSDYYWFRSKSSSRL